MKRFVSLILAVGIIFSVTQGWSSDLPCLKCHGKLEVVAENIKRVGAKSEAELIDHLRNKSTKKALHKQVSDEDIKRAFNEVKARETRVKEETKGSAKAVQVKATNATEKKGKSRGKVSPSTSVNATKRDVPVEKASKKEGQVSNQTKEPTQAPKPTPKKKVEGC